MSKFDTKRNGICVEIMETGEIFNSVQACANRLGVDAKWLGKIVRGESGFKTCHGYHVVAYEKRYLTREVDIFGRLGQKIRIVESGEEFPSARECARSIDGDHKNVLRAARGNKKYKERHFKIID